MKCKLLLLVSGKKYNLSSYKFRTVFLSYLNLFSLGSAMKHLNIQLTLCAL